MKNIKKIALCLLVFALVCSTCLAVACVKPTADTEGNITVVIGDAAYTIDLAKVTDIKNFDSVLDYLKSTQNIVLEYSTSEYGRFYTKIGTVSPVEKNDFVCLYTTVKKDFATWENYFTYDYNGIKLTQSGVGSSSMSIEKGATYAVEIAVYNAEPPADDQQGSFTLVIGDQDYTIDLSTLTIDKGLQSVLDYLKTEEELDLVYTENDGVRTYSQIGSLIPDREKGQFIRLYTSVQNNQMTGSSAKTFTFNDEELVEAKVGVTGLTIQKDCTIALILDYLKGYEPVDVDGTMVLYVGDTAYTIDLSKVEITQGADSLLDYLKDAEDLEIEYTESDYGRYYTRIGSLSPDSAIGEYISVYTSVDSDKGDWEGVLGRAFGDDTLIQAAVGTSSMTIKDGCVIGFAIETFEIPAYMTVYLGTDSTFIVALDDVDASKGLDGVLDYLKETQELDLVYSESDYGRYYTKIGYLAPDADASEYISIYTSVESDQGDWDGVTSKEFGTYTLTQSAVGSSSMTIQNDCVIGLVVESFAQSSEMTLYVGDTAYTIDLSKVEITQGADSILDYLKDTQNLDLVYTEGDYGRYYTQIGDLKPNANNNEFISVYTSVESNQGDWEGVTSKTYGDVTVVSASVGASGLTIEDGCVIAFAIESY